MNRNKPIKANGSWRNFGRMLGKINLPWLLIAIAFVASLVYNHILLSLPTNTAALMSGSLEGTALTDAIIYYVFYGIIVTAQLLLQGFACQKAVQNARTKIWGNMTRIRMDYYDAHTPTALSSAVTNDLEASIRLFVTLMIGLLPSIYYMVSAMAEIGSYDWMLLLSVLICLPLKYVYMVVVGRWNFRVQSGIYGKIGSLTGYLADRVKHLTLIKHYGTENTEKLKGHEVSNALFQANMRGAKLDCAATGISTLIDMLQQIVIIFTGVILLQKGRIDMTQWIAFFLFSGTITSHFSTMVNNWQSLKSIQGQTARAADLVNAPAEQTEAQSKAVVPAAQRNASDIAFRDVSFSYGEKQALKNISFTVPAGTTTAIVGLTGSGKTTSLNLLEGFYGAAEGSVLLGGMDVKQMTLPQLRSHFSYVQQDAGVFSGTIRDILSYGAHRQLSDEELERAARATGAWSFISQLPEGLATKVSVGGSSLSGGQRQRLVLARELLRDASILLLDEPTSALDAKTAAAVEETIFRLFQGKTILLVTHDMSLVKQVDQIVVLENGDMVGRGSYEQLMDSCPLFQEMVQTQYGKEAAV